MESPLSRDTLEQVRTLVRQISVAHDLDAELQAELEGHLEDKVRAYLGGEEKVSEADALLLTSNHFGNPAAIQALFQHVHSRPPVPSIWRTIRWPFLLTVILLLQLPPIFGELYIPYLMRYWHWSPIVVGLLLVVAPIPSAIITFLRSARALLRRRPLTISTAGMLIGCHVVSTMALLVLPVFVAPRLEYELRESQEVLGSMTILFLDWNIWLLGRLPGQMIPGAFWIFLSIPVLCLFAMRKRRTSKVQVA